MILLLFNIVSAYKTVQIKFGLWNKYGYLCGVKKNEINIQYAMATIVLDYNARNKQAQKALDFVFSPGIFKEKKKISGLEEAFEDIEN